MILEGKKEVLMHLFEKQRLLEAGDARHLLIRPLLIVCGGSMRGVYGGGQVTALSEFGLTNAFDNAVGVSTGAPTVAYFLAGQARKGTSIYYEECTTRAFISVPRMLRGGYAMDVDYLASVFRGGVDHKALDQKALLNSRTNFFVVATEVESGVTKLLDACVYDPDSVEPITASIAMPGISHANVVLRNVRYCDGASNPLPVREAIARFKPTDVLVLANCAQGHQDTEGGVGKFLQKFLMRKYPRELQDLFLFSNQRFLQDLSYLRTQGQAQYSIVWGDEDIRSHTTTQKQLKAAAGRAEIHFSQLLHEARADVK